MFGIFFLPIFLFFVVIFAVYFRGTGSRNLNLLYGFLFAIGVGLLYGWIRTLLQPYEFSIGANIFLSAVFSIVVVGFLGEIGKILLLRLYGMPFLDFENSFDGVSWGIILGSGVALGHVSIVYILLPSKDVMEFRLFAEMITSIECGILLGYLAGHLIENDSNYSGLWAGAILTILAHGAFDFCFTMGAMKVLGFLAVIFTFIAIFFVVRAVANDERIRKKYKTKFRQIGH